MHFLPPTVLCGLVSFFFWRVYICWPTKALIGKKLIQEPLVEVFHVV